MGNNCLVDLGKIATLLVYRAMDVWYSLLHKLHFFLLLFSSLKYSFVLCAVMLFHFLALTQTQTYEKI